MGEYKASSCSRKDLRVLALDVRKIFGLESAVYFPIVEVYEVFAAQGVFGFEILPIIEMGVNCGETFPLEPRIAIREDIYVRACMDDGFARTTMAHELLHFFKHDEMNVSLCRSQFEVTQRKPFEEPEWQANCFAGELLIPKHLVEGMTINEVMFRCKVSRKMAEIQLGKYLEGK